MGCNQVKVYNDSDSPLIHKLDWMKEIPDDTKLSQMTIPGTHDSLSMRGCCCCARTQTWSLIEQMRAGLRYFDIRLRRIDDTLRAYHGFVDMVDTFDKILVYALDFLDKNPSETIIMEIISEYDPKNSTKSFKDLYEEYTKDYKDKIASYQNKDITLGEIRGKIFMVKVFEGSTSNIPNFLIQNSWSVNFRWYMNKKKRKIKTSFHRAIAVNDHSKINLNYLSASSDYAMMTPYTAAKQCNEIAMRYHGRLGVVLADYPGEDLIDHLIKQNFIKADQKEEIKSGDKIYMVHNDTHKYLFLDKDGYEGNHIYCVKVPTPLTIRHKNENVGRDNFKIGDDIILTNDTGYDVEFKIGKSFGQCDVIDDQSIFMIQYLKDNELQYIECLYENKVKPRKYLFNFNKNAGSYSYYFTMKKAPIDAEDKK